ncbi:MAG: acyl-CoA synthetase [Gammaproteobacteria bacterium]|nr:acyl-CoA synthetase [Gammaproteobacteria bacterium]MDH3536208.1 acyl-CoA synthetase [Gammaproteobacteria bacterium]
MERELSSSSPFSTDLDKNAANYTPLSPLTFLERAASVYPERCAQIYGETRYSWAETYRRCRRLASALQQHGIQPDDAVALMLPNLPAMFEAHFAIPMAGAVIHALNIRLDADAIAFQLRHGGARILITDREFSATVAAALAQLDKPPLVIDVDDPAYAGGEMIGELGYEELLAEGDPEFEWDLPDDEWRAIALGYTSGTTGDPKGVVTHHRGAYLNAVSNTLAWNMGAFPVYLWTLPMFHCNGWCFPWTIAALNGTSLCLRAVRADDIFQSIKKHRVTHLCGAPIVLSLMANADEELKQGIDHEVNIMTAASAPPPSILEAMARLNFNVTHAYGLTEVYGPAVVCAWHDEWNDLSLTDQSDRKARQGVRYPMLEDLVVADPETLEPVPRDGETIGEIMFRGNIVMKGYLKNPDASRKAFAGGYFHSGDLAVCHPDGYIEIKDRSKDIIISGGENISSIEIEKVLYRHPAVLEAAVAAMPDDKWGETPCAFVTLREGADAGEQEIINFCRDHMAHFKAPRKVVFGPLPKTSTGKIQKFELRERARKP